MISLTSEYFPLLRLPPDYPWTIALTEHSPQGWTALCSSGLQGRDGSADSGPRGEPGPRARVHTAGGSGGICPPG